MVLKILY